MPRIHGLEISDATYSAITREIGGGSITGINVALSVADVSAYRITYTTPDGIPQTFFYREPVSTQQSDHIVGVNSGRSWGNSFMALPDTEIYSFTLGNRSITPQRVPTQQSQLRGAGYRPLGYADGMNDDYADDTFLSYTGEDTMTTPENNTVKKYKNYLTVTYDESYAKYNNGVFRIDIFDILTGELLGSNGVTMSIRDFNGFEAYATAYYENLCPILNREEPQAPRCHSELNINDSVIEMIKLNIQSNASLEKIHEEDVKAIINRSNPDNMSYWLEPQVRLYQMRVAAAGAKKFLEDVKNISATGELDVSIAMLQLYGCLGASRYRVEPIETYTKSRSMHYRLSELLSEPAKVDLNIKIFNKNTQSFIKDFIRFKIEKKSVDVPKKLTEEQLIVRLPTLKSELSSYTYNLYGTEVFRNAAYDSIYFGLVKSKISRSSFTKLFTIVNELKNHYMFTGQSEEEAMVNALAQDVALSEDKRCKEFGYCSVTKQFLPMLFLTPYKNGYISTYYAYIHSATDASAATPMYHVGENYNNAVDSVIKPLHEYEVSVFNHRKNAMDYLTVRKLADENTTITCDESLFKPTPFLGIELEVQQQDTVKYHINGKEQYAPENITSQCYEALGRDYVILKKDGSLRGVNPFEIVTVPATLGYHQARWESFLNNKELKKYLTSFASGNCGMHVHINRDSFTGLHLAKFMRFINSRDNMDFITSVAQRSHNRYAEYLSETSSGGFARYFRGNPDRAGRNEEKYMAVNTRNLATVEVRIFRGNLAKVGFLKNLEFVHAAWSFTKDAPLTSLTFKEFMFWLFNPSNNTKDYKHLKMWLLASGWNVDGVVVKKTDTGIVRKRKEERRAQIMKARDTIRKQFTDVKDKAPPPIGKDEIISAA